jgi:hypothetical protein
LRCAHGAEHNRIHVAEEIEDGEITLLPDQIELGRSQVVVQPDATIVTQRSYVLVEAKRIRSSSFQTEQLAREFVALMRDCGSKVPLLLVLLGAAPPVRVKGLGWFDLSEAVATNLAGVVSRTPELAIAPDDLVGQIPEVVAWITWGEVRDIVTRQLGRYSQAPDGLAGTVRRLVASVVTAIEWHT